MVENASRFVLPRVFSLSLRAFATRMSSYGEAMPPSSSLRVRLRKECLGRGALCRQQARCVILSVENRPFRLTSVRL